ncbi:MAG: hypothetical protein AB1774_04250 [Bacillota bacterium]
MEVQDARDARRELQAIQEAIGQQNLIMQRLERNLRRLEDSYGKVTARLDAIEAARAAPDPEKAPTAEKARPGHLVSFGGQGKHTSRESSDNPGATPTPEAPPARDPGPAPAQEAGSRPSLAARAKSALRGAILDGSVNATLDKVQTSLQYADEAAGAISQIGAMVKASLEASPDIRQTGIVPIPGGSLALLLDLAKTSQFQKFIANIVAQFLKESEHDQMHSPDKPQE